MKKPLIALLAIMSFNVFAETCQKDLCISDRVHWLDPKYENNIDQGLNRVQIFQGDILSVNETEAEIKVYPYFYNQIVTVSLKKLGKRTNCHDDNCVGDNISIKRIDHENKLNSIEEGKILKVYSNGIIEVKKDFFNSYLHTKNIVKSLNCAEDICNSDYVSYGRMTGKVEKIYSNGSLKVRPIGEKFPEFISIDEVAKTDKPQISPINKCALYLDKTITEETSITDIKTYTIVEQATEAKYSVSMDQICGNLSLIDGEMIYQSCFIDSTFKDLTTGQIVKKHTTKVKRTTRENAVAVGLKNLPSCKKL